MLNQIFEEYGDQLTSAIEVIFFIVLVATIFFGGTIGNIILSIPNGMC